MSLSSSKAQQASLHAKIRKRMLLLIALAMQLTTNFTAKAADCYPKSENLLPHVFMAVDGTGTPIDSYNRLESIAGWLDPTNSDDFLVYGGSSQEFELTSIANKAGVVMRMDLSENKIRWARHYEIQDINHLFVANLAIKPDGQQIVVHGSPQHSFTLGFIYSIIFVIRAKDGGHVTKKAKKINHDLVAKFLMTSNNSMLFTSYGTVVMTWTVSYKYNAGSQNLMNCEKGNIECDARMRIAQFNVGNENLDFYLEQGKYFGQSTAIAYGHWSSNADTNIYLGGAADDSRYEYVGDTQNWAPALYNLNSDGNKKELWKMKIGGGFQTDNMDHAVIDFIKLDKTGNPNYLFGTTKKHAGTDRTQLGSMIYCWRVELKSDHLIDDSQSPLIKRLEAPLGTNQDLYKTWVTGISESLYGSYKKFDLIMQGNSVSNTQATRQLWYVKIDFDSSIASALRLYEQVDAASFQSVFVNTQDGSNGSYHNVQRSYTMSRTLQWTDDYGSHTYTEDMDKGLILPSLWSETCFDAASSPLETDFQLIESTGNTLLKNNEEEFTTSMRTPPVIQAKNIYMMDINFSKMYPRSYCTEFTTTVSAADITPGFITDTTSLGKCGLQFDDNEYEIPFTKPVISSPTCDDDSHVWAAWIEPLNDINTNDYDSSKFKVAIDMTDSKIKITGHSGKNHALQTVYFRAHFMLPDGITTSFDFKVGTAAPSNCDSQTLSPPTNIVNYSYQLGQPSGQHNVDPFTQTYATCGAIIYTNTVKADFALVPSLSAFINPNAARGAFWYLTNDAQYIGTYTVTITATQGCSTAQASFTFTVNDSVCATDTFTINTGKFDNPALTYDIRAPMATFAWTDSDVLPNAGTTAECGNLAWEITQSDGSAIDSTIFGYTTGQQSLTTYSELISKAGQYQMQVKVYWQAHSQTSGVQIFRIDLVDSCDTSVVVTPPTITNPSLYLIGQPQVVLNYGAFSVSPSYCVTSTNYGFNPSPPDASAIQVNVSAKTVTIYSTDLATGRDASNNSPATYTLKIYQVTEGGTGQYGSEQIEYTITIGDPCKTSTIVIDPAFYTPSGAQSYTIGTAEQTITVDQSKISNGVTPVGICPDYAFQLTNIDGTNVNSNLFTFETTGTQPLIKIQTSDHSIGPNFYVILQVSYNDAVYSQQTNSATITISTVNPCESATLVLNPSQFFSDATYVVGSPIGFEADFSSGLHDETTTPQIGCGDYSVVFEQRDATDPSNLGTWQALSSPLSVDQVARKLQMSITTDPSQIGKIYELRYKVQLVDYADRKTPFSSSTFKISLIDPCSTGVTLVASSITNPPEYKYTGSSPGIQHDIPLFTVSPSDCSVTYTCSTTSGPAASNDLCAISDGFTVSSLQTLATKLVWSFESTQTEGQPNSQKAGDYTIQISGVAGTAGQATASSTFVFKLTNPCPGAVITHNVSPFVPETYNIGNPPMVRAWDQNIATADTDPANCGNYVISIWIYVFNSDQSFEILRPGYFVIDGSAQTVTSPGPTVTATVQQQIFKYKVFLQQYPSRITPISQWPTLLIVTDTCGSPTISDPGLATYDLGVYAYTGVAMSQTLSNFAVTPIECPVTYTCTSTGPAGAPDICPGAGISNMHTTSTWDASLATWTFLTTDVMTDHGGTYPAGAYTLSITGTTGVLQDKTDQMVYTLTFTDPCVSSLGIAVTNPLVDMTYTLRDPELASQSWAGNELGTLSTNAVCGPLTYTFFRKEASGNTAFASLSPNPFKVEDPNPKTFRVPQTQDTSAAAVYQIVYSVGLAYYPSASVSQTVPFTITIVDPCNPPTSITPSAAIATVYYTVDDPTIAINIPNFTVDPVWCELTYDDPKYDKATETYSYQTSDMTVTSSNQADSYQKSYGVNFTGSAGGLSATFTLPLIVKNPCVDPLKNWIIAPDGIQKEYLIKADALSVDYLTGYNYDVQLQTCGLISTVISNGLSSQITNDLPNNSIVVQSDELTLRGTQQIVTVTTSLVGYPTVTKDTLITIDFSDSCQITESSVLKPVIADQSYQIGDAPVFIQFDDFTSEEVVLCGFSWSYTAQLASEPFGTGDMATYLSFDETTKKFEVYSTTGIAQDLQVVLKASLENGRSFNVTFTVSYSEPEKVEFTTEEKYTIKNNLEPEFVEPLQTIIQFDLPASNGTVQQPYSTRQNIGKLADYEGDSFDVKFIGFDDYDFLSPVFDQEGDLFIDLSYLDTSLAQSGNYSLQVEVTQTVNDTEQPSKRFPFSVEVLAYTDSQEQKQKEQTETEVDYFTPTITIENDEPEVDVERQVFEPPTMKMAKTDKFGLVEIVFSERMLVPSDWQTLNETNLDVKLSAFDEEMQVLMDFDWTVTSFSGERMMIQFTFKNPKQISMNVQGKDILSIDVITPNKFTAEKSMLTVQDITEISIKVPKQERLEDKELIEDITAQASTVNQGTSTIMGSSFVLNILLASSLSLLWGLINSMQLVTHFPLLNYRWPYSASIIFGQLYELATLDLIPTDWAEDKISEEVGQADRSETNFDAEEYLSDGTIEAGYDSGNVMLNSILQTAMIVAGIIAGLLLLLLRVFFYKVQFIKRALIKLWRAIFWNFFIRLILESYLELAMNNWIRVLASDDSTWWEKTSSGFAFSLLTIMTLMGLLTPVFLHYKLDKLKTEDFKSKYGALVEQLRVEDPSMRCYQMFFMLRRLTFAMMIVFMPQTPWAQTQLLCLQCSMHLIYAGVRPFYLPYMNRLELANEYLVLTSSYFLFIYSDAFLMEQRMGVQVKQEEMQERVGMAQVVLLGIQVALNITIMVTVQVYVIYRKIKLCFMKKAHKRNMKEYEARRKLKEELQQGPVDDGDPSQILPNGQRVISKQRIGQNDNQIQQQLQAIPEEDQVKEYSSRDNDRSGGQQNRGDQDKLLLSQQQLESFSLSSEGSDGLILNDALREKSRQWQKSANKKQHLFRPNQSNAGFSYQRQNPTQFNQDYSRQLRLTDTVNPASYQNVQINTRGVNADFLQDTLLRNRAEYQNDGPVHAPIQIPAKKSTYVKPELMISKHYPIVDGPLLTANEQSYYDQMKMAYDELLKEQAQNQQNK